MQPRNRARALRRVPLALALAGACLFSCVPTPEPVVSVGVPASVLVFPYLTGAQAPNALEGTSGDVLFADEGVRTELTISNRSTQTVRLLIDVIDGDPHPSWGQCSSLSLVCDLQGIDGNSAWTGRGTTRFVVSASGDRSSLRVSCYDPFRRKVVDTVRAVSGQNGILFVAAADPTTGNAVASDDLEGSALLVDLVGARSVLLPPLAFQSGAGPQDGDKVYRFDGFEYAKWPDALTTSFAARQPGVRSELVLFTLDHTLGSSRPPRVALGGLAYGARPEPLDFQYAFDCFDVVAVDEVDPNLFYSGGSSLGLGSATGRLELTPQPVGAGSFDVHDASFGDANSVRRRPAHGWILESLASGDLVGRVLGASTLPLAPFLNDLDPALAADPRL